jgi:hypothetical protein
MLADSLKLLIDVVFAMQHSPSAGQGLVMLPFPVCEILQRLEIFGDIRITQSMV